ncbi:MAG: Spy/CpxP family protein refolding chaperone [Labilithrix sp.]
MKLAPRVSFSSLLLCTALSAVACGGSVEQPQNTAQAASKAPIAANAHGPIKAMGEALGEVALRPDQRTEIEKLATDAEARHAPLSAGRKDLMLAFADQVEKGSIDRAALTGKLDKITADMERSRNDDRAALVKLHDLLDKQQRNEFVDALEKNFKAKHGFGGEGEGAGPPRMGFGHMHKLAEDLKLTDDQKDKIKDVFKESWRENMKEHHGGKHAGGPWGGHHKGGKHALEAFREDKLDLDKVAPPQDLKAMANGGVEHVAKIAEKVLPILTPEQRKIAADKLREMANGGDTSLLVH